MSQESQNFEFEREADLGRGAGAIEKKLAEVLPDRKKAAEVAGEIYSAALEIDGTINQILRDPEFVSRYYYDGMILKKKDSNVFHVAPDGMNLFRILMEQDMLKRYFEANDWDIAINGLRDRLNKYRMQANSLLLHWQENKAIPSSINKEAEERIKRDLAAVRGEEAPPSPSEESFLQEYEREMREFFEDNK